MVKKKPSTTQKKSVATQEKPTTTPRKPTATHKKPSISQRKRQASTSKQNSFWTQFHGFVPTPKANLQDEFKRLARHMRWEPKTDTYLDYRAQAYQTEAEFWYGKDATKLECWQTLCKEVGIEPVPQSVLDCKKALRGVHINLVNLVDCRRSGEGPPRRFPTLDALRKYTREEDKVYPKDAAKEEGFIKELLREMVPRSNLRSGVRFNRDRRSGRL